MNKGVFALLTSTILYGLLGVFSRLIGIEFGIFFQSWTRNLIAAVLILPFFFFYSWKKVRNKDLKWFVIRSIGDLITMTCIFIAFNTIQIGTSYFLFYAGSLIGGYLIGYYIFKETFTKQSIISLLVAISGLILIYSMSLEANDLFFYLLANVAGLSSSIWNVFSKKVSKDYSTPQVVIIDCIITLLIGLVLSILFAEKFIQPAFTTQWIATVLFAVNSLVTSFLIVYGFKFVEASYGSLLLLFEILFGLLFSYIFFQEAPGLITFLGGMLILLATVIPKLNVHKVKKT